MGQPQKKRIPSKRNKYKTEVTMQLEHSENSRKVSQETLEGIQRRGWVRRQLTWVPEGHGGNSGFYSECRRKPLKNLEWKSDIIRYMF